MFGLELGQVERRYTIFIMLKQVAFFIFVYYSIPLLTFVTKIVFLENITIVLNQYFCIVSCKFLVVKKNRIIEID